VRGLFLLAAISVTGIGTAHACLAPPFERHAFFADRPSARLGSGLEMLRVQVIDPASLETTHADWTMVTVLEAGLGFEAGDKLRVEVDMDSSCSRWGHVDGPAYIVGYVRRLEGKPAVFSARSFRLAQIQRNPVPRRK
jgi:hypothetical protein